MQYLNLHNKVWPAYGTFTINLSPIGPGVVVEDL